MKTPQEILNDCSGFEVPDGMVYMKTSDVIKAITEYHAQFTITSETKTPEDIDWNPRNDANCEAVPQQTKTPEEILNEKLGNYFGIEINAIIAQKIHAAIIAYHDQFTITPSERERQIAIAFAEWKGQRYLYVTPSEKVWNEFIQSDLFKSIPPAMPSREEAQKWIKALTDSTTQGFEADVNYYHGGMEMYDHLTERAKQ